MFPFQASQSGSDPGGEEKDALMVAAVVWGSHTRGDHVQGTPMYAEVENVPVIFRSLSRQECCVSSDFG